ncbi:MAG: hypothetical protein IIY94_01450 [Oscillospiraceae bacterium]|nr:hypothetical protein [Oscillospiraceae bacterium]
MKVKKTVAALCLAAIMATSVGASAWVPWEDEKPDKDIGTWQTYSDSKYIYSRFTPKSNNGKSGAYVHDKNWNYYVMDFKSGGLQANATLKRSDKSKDGTSVVSLFWKWEHN